MKNLLIAIVIFTGSLAYGLDAGKSKAFIQDTGLPAAISVSTSVWTAVPSTFTVLGSRSGTILTAKADVVSSFNIMLSSYSHVPTISTDTAPMQIGSDSYRYLDVSQYVYIWAVSNNGLGGIEDLYYQEFLLEIK